LSTDIHERLSGVATSDAMAWLDGVCAQIAAGAPDPTLFFAYSAVGRRFADADTREAARALLLLAVPATDADSYRAICDKLCNSADAGELIAFYRSLPVLPFPKAHVARCSEGLRTNIAAVFGAIAHDNSYPADHLDEVAWNTMVLKALFIDIALHPIVGLDRRANPALMRMLCDYAHERWAANRSVSPELWRCVGPHADDAALADLERVLTTGDDRERRAATEALRSCDRPEAATLLARYPEK